METGEAQTYSWCDPGERLPEEREGSEIAPLPKPRADQSHGAALILLPNQVPSPALPRPGALVPCAWCFNTVFHCAFLKNHEDCFSKHVSFVTAWFCCCWWHCCCFSGFFKRIKDRGAWGLPGYLSLLSFFYSLSPVADFNQM